MTTHPQGFRLMTYTCMSCGFSEDVWNSRDGRMPDAIECAAEGVGGPGERMSVHVLQAAGVDPGCLTRCGGRATLRGPRAVYTALDLERLDELVLPTWDPEPGERYVRDGTPAEARGRLRRSAERHLVDPEKVAQAMAVLGPEGPDAEGWEAQHAPGWPLVVVRGSDADLLPPWRPVEGAS